MPVMSKENMDLRNRYKAYEECELSYLRGMKIAGISKESGVEVRVLERWRKEYYWEEKKRLFLLSTRGITDLVKELLDRKVSSMRAAGEVDIVVVEEIGKIMKTMNQIGNEGIGQSGVMEVIRDFTLWIRGRVSNIEEYRIISFWLQKYVNSMVMG
jgi:hypothetical protein